VLVALCRPLKDSAYAAPATNKAIADEIISPSMRQGASAAGRRRGQAARVLSAWRGFHAGLTGDAWDDGSLCLTCRQPSLVPDDRRAAI